jgi:hypothetical protein
MSWAASWDLRVFDRGTESYTRFGKLRIEYGWIAVSLFIDMLPGDSVRDPVGQNPGRERVPVVAQLSYETSFRRSHA